MNIGTNKTIMMSIKIRDGDTTIAGILIHSLQIILIFYLMLVPGVTQKEITIIIGATVILGAVDNVIKVRTSWE